MKQGTLSINSENIFPIIKKWLYSDHDIFARELVSNGVDAITKLKKLAGIGEFDKAENEEYRIIIVQDEKNATLQFIDNGLGMTAEEIEKYINDIAFSGATDFLEKYKDKSDTEQIIGHFGLGFYSAFMVSTKVEIDTLSYKEGAKAVHWTNDGGTEFTLDETNRTLRGTEITLHIADDSKEFLSFQLRSAISKYCSYMPVPIYILSAEEYEKFPNPFLAEISKPVDKAMTEDSAKGEHKESTDTTKKVTSEETVTEAEKEPRLPAPINDTHPLYLKRPNEVSDEEYKEFYRQAFMDFKEPIFWIHLNMDYPFNLKGIIYFPRAKNEYEFAEGHIKLYNTQVFVDDNVNEVTPEFLTVLNGVIDCPDLPLNVSRSALQNDGFVKKISDYIGKKVADKLKGLSKNDRELYESSWKDIGPFIEFGVIRDEKFAEQMKNNLLFEHIDGNHLTLKELKDAVGENSIYYTNDPMRQTQYIEAQRKENHTVVVLKHTIEQALMSHLEMTEEGLTFKRVDSVDEEKKEEVGETLAPLFQSKVSLIALADEMIPAMFVQDENSRRSMEFAKMYGIDMPSAEKSLVLNKNNSIVKKLIEAENTNDETKMVAEYIESIAKISSDDFTKEDMNKFTKISNAILNKLL